MLQAAFRIAERRLRYREGMVCMNEKNLLDRRGFLKGALASGAVAAAGAALVGCAPQQSVESATASASDLPESGQLPDGYQCREDWLGQAPVIDDAEIVDTVEVDVVVCGGGHAGVQAALAAAQEGASVAVLEVQPEETYSFFGDDICSYNSAFLAERGFGGYDVGEICAEYVRRGAGRVSPELIRVFVEQSGEMLDNMVSVVPDTSTVFDFDNGQCQVQIAYDMPDASFYPLERGGFKAWATTIQTIGTVNEQPVLGREGVSRLTEVELYCMDAARNLGATWYFNTSATVLEQSSSGEVTGVIAKGPDGYVRYRAAKAVCLCTGDFSSNADMVYNLLDDVNEIAMRSGADRSEMIGRGRDGQGQKMGCWAGGLVECHPRPSMNTNGGSPGPWGTTPFLWINAEGKRFMNECMAGFAKPLITRQPHGLVAAICDANYLESVQNAGLDHGAPNWGAAGVERYGVMDKLKEGMDAAVDAGAAGAEVGGVGIINVTMTMGSQVFAAQTLDELLGYLEYEGDAKKQALSTIEAYNALCATGVDSDYGKDALLLKPIDTPPFFGAVARNEGAMTAGLVTLAGLVTDEHMNVLTSDYTTPIPGLYAAGNCLGHRFGPGYSTPSAGASMGMAMTHGRVLGKHVASL